MTECVARVSDLRVELSKGRGVIVDDVSFTIAEGELLGLVGESGSGKTTTANALLGYARRGSRITGGSIEVCDRDLLSLSSAELRTVRGATVGYVPQDPATALNPAVRIGAQLQEIFEVHELDDWLDRSSAALEGVKLPCTPEFLRRYPHQLSGGQQQRVSLALAFALQPKLIVLDEPTTGLDVTTQTHILDAIEELCVQNAVAALYVTHDLALLSNFADRVVVMYAGRLAEAGSRASVFEAPAHPYTAALLDSTPDIRTAQKLTGLMGTAPPIGRRTPGCEFANRCPAAVGICLEDTPPTVWVADDHMSRCHRTADPMAVASRRQAGRNHHQIGDAVLEVSSVSARYGERTVLNNVSLTVGRNECVALVGESGSGKTTLARAIIGLHTQRSGDIRLSGETLPADARSRSSDAHRRMQYVFQSPYESLNPRKTVSQLLSTSLCHFYPLHGAALRTRLAECVEQVHLSSAVLSKYPHQLSGGERQRVAIGRALACEPEILICDEVTSALDVSVQASIVELLQSLRSARGLSMLFITHNLALVRSVADRIAVMNAGQIIETGSTNSLLDAPSTPYAQELVRNTPTLTSPATLSELRGS